MAFSILLAQKLNISCLCYDPAFTELDKKILTQIDKCSVTEDNNDCSVEINESTIVVGVHLFKKHYQNLIVKNFDNLIDLVLIGNEIEKLVENHSLEFEIDGLKSVINKQKVIFDVGKDWVKDNKRTQDSDVF